METDARPPQNLSKSGNLSLNWSRWRKEFQTYMRITKGNEKPEDEQVDWLKNFIGPIGLGALEKMSLTAEEENITIVLQKLEQFFNPVKNEIEERYKFFSHTKRSNESIDRFIEDLRSMAKSCNFGDQTESLIRDAVILGFNDRHLRSLLFEEKDLTMEKIKLIYKTYMANSKKIRDVSNGSTSQKAESLTEMKTQSVTGTRSRDASASRMPKLLRRPPSLDRRKPCRKCGRNHPLKACPAYRFICAYCSELNHFTHCCPNTKLDKININNITNTKGE